MVATQPPDPVARLLAAWQEAFADLQVHAAVRRLDDAVLVGGFGRRGGTLCIVGTSSDRIAAAQHRASELGAAWSMLSDAYLVYDRGRFVDTLNDWGWTGAGDPPAWYSGAPWG